MAQITPIFVVAFVFFAFVIVVKSGDFERIENVTAQWFSNYKPMPKEWQTFLAKLAHPATDKNKTTLPAFIANFFHHIKSSCSHELLREVLDKIKVWKAITGCYIVSATRETNGDLKMDYKVWNQEHVRDIDSALAMAKLHAPGYIDILQNQAHERGLGDKNHIGNKLADHFEIVMQYVGDILEKMKGCFKDEKNLDERISAILLNNGAIPLFEQLSGNKNALVAGMKHE